MGTKRSNFSLVPMGGKLVAAGGYDGRGVTDVVEVPILNLQPYCLTCQSSY